MYFCFTESAKAFDCGSQQTVENSQRDGNTISPYLPPEKSVCRSRNKLELDMGQYASKSGKLSSVHRTGKDQFSLQSQRKAMPKNAQTTAQLHSSHTTSKVMLKILKAKLQQYMNCELPDVQAGFRKGRGARGQIANIRWITEKAREFQKNICFIEYAKAFDCVDHNKLWKILKEMGIPDHLVFMTCLLRNI